MYILQEGAGNYNDTPVVNPSNPVRRDVQNVRPFGHIVVQMDTTNPGIWPFHCHVAWHASAGFFSQLILQPEKIDAFKIPASVEQTCREWHDFTNRAIPNQIDSGL